MDVTKSWKAILIGVFFGLLSIGFVLLITRPPRGAPIQLKPPPTPSPLIVHVTGAVVEPGIYTLALGARVQDAIDAAGGNSPNADLEAINLAAFVEDGEQLWVPTKKMANPEPHSGATSTVIPNLNNEAQPPNQEVHVLININMASIPELESLPGIGPDKAEKIVAYRTEHGPFERIEEIENVSGIGPVTFEKIKALICVSDQP
jgi:competence protein ComEA